MIPNNNFSVLPWYTSIDEQNAHKWWAYGRIYPLFSLAEKCLPFQILIPHVSSPSITSIELINANTNGVVGEYLSAFNDAGLTIKQFSTYDVVVFPNANATLFPLLPIGRYYLRATINGIQWFSDVFTEVESVDGCLKIEWWDEMDFIMDDGAIVYTEPTFKNILYLDSDLAKPEYPFEEEGETRDGYFFPIKQISEKRYKFNFLAPEYLLDVMRFVRMADHVHISKNTQTYYADTFLLTPQWEGDGDIASVEAEFDTATVAKKIGNVTGGVTPTDYLSVNPISLVFVATGQSLVVSVSSNVAWSLSVPSWISASALSGQGNETITLTAAQNTGSGERSDFVTFSGLGVSNVSVAVTQLAPSAKYLAVNPTSIAFNASGQNVDVTITSNVAWNISVPSWVTYSVISGSTSGNAVVRLTAPANQTGFARSDNVVFSGTDVPSVNVNVSQATAFVPSISISPSSMNVDYNARTFYFRVTANARWECSGSTEPIWLNSSATGQGTGAEETAVINIGANSGALGRTGVLTFRLIDYPNVTTSTTITQAGYNPVTTYEIQLSAINHTFGANGAGSFAPTVYGVTKVDGVETFRETLSASELSFTNNGDPIATRNGLVFTASDLGTNIRLMGHEIWGLTWNAHPTATATAQIDIYQQANSRTTDSQYTEWIPQTTSIVWNNSGTSVAGGTGDTAVFSAIATNRSVTNYSYTSGATETIYGEWSSGEAVLAVAAQSGTDLSVSGPANNQYTITWGANGSGATRNGVIRVYNQITGANPSYVDYQVSQGVPTYDSITVRYWEGSAYNTATYSRPYIHNNSIMVWRHSTLPNKYTRLYPSIGDLVYDDTALTQVFGEIIAVQIN